MVVTSFCQQCVVVQYLQCGGNAQNSTVTNGLHLLTFSLPSSRVRGVMFSAVTLSKIRNYEDKKKP